MGPTLTRRPTFFVSGSWPIVWESGVDVRLQRSAVRWISVADSSGRRVTGIGPTARAAIVASVDWLEEATVSEFLADLRLLEVSRRLHELRAG